jgi:hypothetical protein
VLLLLDNRYLYFNGGEHFCHILAFFQALLKSDMTAEIASVVAIMAYLTELASTIVMHKYINKCNTLF